MKIDSPARREAMASPLRLELLEHLGAMETATVRDLAERMGKSPHALHYHVRLLAREGILRVVGTRRSGPRDQAVFDLAADKYEITGDDPAASEKDVYTRVVRAVLRSAERDYAALAESDAARLESSDVFAGRMRAPLSATARREVMRHIKAIQRIFLEESHRDHPQQARVEPFTFTSTLLPETRPDGGAGVKS